MAAKKNVAVTPAFTGRNVSLSEISQASGDQHRYYCPDRLVYLKTGYFNPNPEKQDTDSEAV